MLFRLPIVKFFNRILNRITVTVVLVALQLAWMAWVFFALTTGTARVWVTGVLNGLSLLIVLYLVRKDENSAYKVGWIALIGLLPLLGGALYLAFGNKRPSRRLRSKMQAVEQAHRTDRAQQPGQDRRAVRRKPGREPLPDPIRLLSRMAEHHRPVFLLRRSHVSGIAGRP